MATYQQLMTALADADANNDSEAADLFARMLKNKEYDEQSSGVASALQGIGQGTTLGFGDELGAGVRAATEKPVTSFINALGKQSGLKRAAMTAMIPGMMPLALTQSLTNKDTDMREFAEDYKDYQEYFPGTFGERYRDALESQRGALETARREDPWITGIAEVVGGLGTGGVGVAKAAAGKALLPGLARMGGVGMGLGTAAGYGYSEADPISSALIDVMGEDATPETIDKVKNEFRAAGLDTAIGGTIGGVAGVALPAAGSTLRSAARVVSRPFTKNARLNEAGRRQVAEALQQDLAAGNITLGQAKQELASTPGMTIADLGPNLQGLTEDIAQTPTAAGTQLRKTLEARTIDQYDRIMPHVSNALGRSGKTSQFHDELVLLTKTAKNAADPMYKEAYATPVRITRKMNNVLYGTRAGAIARKDAEALQKELGKKLPAVGKMGTDANTESLDLVMQSMQQHVNRLYATPGRGKLAGAAKSNLKTLREAVYEQNPALRDARKVWAGFAESDEALNLGRRIFKDDFDLTANTVKKMSEGEKTYFRVGVLKEIENRLSNKLDTADITGDLLKRRKVRDALRVAFGSEDNFNDVMSLLSREARMQETYRLAVGNSATARRLAKNADFGEKLASLAGYGVTLSTGPGLPPSIGGYLARKGYQASGADQAMRKAYEQAAQKQAELLLGRTPQALNTLMQPRTLGGLLDTGVPTSSEVLTGGLLAGGAFTGQ